ncbi:MAG TPA: hypothetical protein VK031_05080, partial [Tissierellaceae bacterium]|nr:hypothetical protein [Tissierellaceae bacterium]
LLSRNGLYTYRKNNLVGKSNVGQYSLSQIYHTLFQQVGSYIDKERTETTDYDTFFKQILRKGGRVPHNTIGGNISLSGKYTEDDVDLITEIINQAVGGSVDMTADQFLAQLRFTEQRGPVAMTMIRAGVPLDTVVALINQPIVDKYISLLNDVGANNLLNEYRAEQILEQIPASDRGEIIRVDRLWDNIKNPKGAKDQRAIFNEFLHWAVLSDQVFQVQQGINYDRSKFNDPALIGVKATKRERALNNNVITNIDKILDTQFLGNISDNLDNVRGILSTFMAFESGQVREVINNIISKHTQPGQFMPQEEVQSLVFKIKSHLINYLLQTQENPTNGKPPLSTRLPEMLIDSDTSVANRVYQVFKKLKYNFSELGQSLNNFAPTSTIKGAPINLALHKRGQDVNTENAITNKIRDFRDSVKFGDDLEDAINGETLYKDFIKLSLIQSGIENSPISYTSSIPIEDYVELIKPYIDQVEKMSHSDLKAFEDEFLFNQWQSDLVSKVEKAKNATKGIPKYLQN